MESVQVWDVFDVNCPSRAVMEHISSKWGVLVQILLLRSGTLRFSELRRAIGGVSEKMLSQTLQTLERDGLVNRLVHPVIPPHVDYSLTDLGVRAATTVNTLFELIGNNWAEFEAAQIAYDRRKATA
ncbi:DNA-binding HxlR family transcriptional regulator [Kibdelosporangium banguiense]|uniref:DNA-binding HxlR family transcriptional regulator n=1 Tax=Kibdelosporangium banguiense TaxID=1365924 RepID=A0ABS4TB73_9PSEU|nr:helix-turn-helix domain-containing protein [Kibdelosporangium banguiense]MBP2321101.1 DNA-binding HxlR family transcriptional regulator [Kibdelosporangium banguiense]